MATTTTTRRHVLVGEANPHSVKPSRALYPHPRNAAGDRLRRLLGLTDREYLRTFPRRTNLCAGRWNLREARAAAAMLSSERLVLLGANVARAFGVPYEPFASRGRFLVLPHPSGRCRTWNHPSSRAELARALEGFL